MLLRPRRARAAVLALLAAAPLSVGLLVLPAAAPSVWADEPSAAPTSSPAPDDPDPDEPKPTPSRTGGPPKLPTLPPPSSPTPEPERTERPTAKPTRTAAPATTAPKRRRTPAPTAADRHDERDDVAPAAPPAVQGRDWSLSDDPPASPAEVRPTDVALAGSRTTSDQLQGVVGAVVAGALVLGLAGGAGLWLTREDA